MRRTKALFCGIAGTMAQNSNGGIQPKDKQNVTDSIIDGATKTVSEGFGVEGTITSKSIVGPMENDALDQLIVAMRKRNAYVIITTQEYSEGAIRGRIQHESRLK